MMSGFEQVEGAPIALRWEDGEDEVRRLSVGGHVDPIAVGRYVEADGRRCYRYSLVLPGQPFNDLDLPRTDRRAVEKFIEGVVTAWVRLAAS